MSAVLVTRRVTPKAFLVLWVASMLIISTLARVQYPDTPIWGLLYQLVMAVVIFAVAWRSIQGWLPPHPLPRAVERVGSGGSRWWWNPAARRIGFATAAISALFIGTAALASYEDSYEP